MPLPARVTGFLKRGKGNRSCIPEPRTQTVRYTADQYPKESTCSDGGLYLGSLRQKKAISLSFGELEYIFVADCAKVYS